LADNTSLAKRTVTSALVIILVALVMLYFPNWAFSLLASIMVGFALMEFFNIVERKKILVYKYIGIIIGMCVPVMIYFQKGIEGYFYRSSRSS